MKPWYRSKLGFFLLVVVWPFSLLWYLWYRAKLNHIVKILLTPPLLFSVLIYSLFIYFLFNPVKNNGTRSVDQKANSEVTPSVTQDVFIESQSSVVVTPSELTISPTETKPSVFDVPKLVGKNIDEARVILGDPADGNLTEPNDSQKELGVSEWDNTFKKDGTELLITFNPSTRKINDFFIGTNDPSGATTDKEQLLNLGKLSTDASSYSVEYVQARKYPNRFTGIKIIPNQ